MLRLNKKLIVTHLHWIHSFFHQLSICSFTLNSNISCCKLLSGLRLTYVSLQSPSKWLSLKEMQNKGVDVNTKQYGTGVYKIRLHSFMTEWNGSLNAKIEITILFVNLKKNHFFENLNLKKRYLCHSTGKVSVKLANGSFFVSHSQLLHLVFKWRSRKNIEFAGLGIG